MNQNKFFAFQNFIDKKKNIILLIIIILSFLVKLFCLNYFLTPSFFDVQAYLETVDQFLKGVQVSDQIMPGYPIIVYLVNNIIKIEIFNIIVSCLTVLIIYDLSRYIYDKILFKLTLVLFIAFYPFNIFYSITGFSETVYVFFLSLMMLFFYKNKVFYATIVGTIAILIKPVHFYTLFILIFFFDFFYFKKSVKESFKNFILCVIIFVFMFSPWWMYNFKKYNKFIMFNLVAPHTLFIGNNPLNQSGGGVMIDKYDLETFPERFTKLHQDFSYDLMNGYPGFVFNLERNRVDFKEGNKAALDRYYSYLDYSKKYIKNNPKRFLELATKKFIRFWRLWPYTQEFNKSFYIIISLISFGPILFLFILSSLKFLRKFDKKLFPLILIIFYFNFVHIILISSIRYRFPIENFIIISALYFAFTYYNNSRENKLI